MKYDIVLCPDLKKNYVHYDIELHNVGGNKTWRERLGIHYSSSYGGCVDYPFFRPDVDDDIEEMFNKKIDLEYIVNRCYYDREERKNLLENINSITIKYPIYYCPKSKLVWQDLVTREDAENPTFSDKLIEMKVCKRGSRVNVAGCQVATKAKYDGLV
jgi:hypothetical protein